MWVELGTLLESVGRYAEAAECFGRVGSGAIEYAVAEKAVRECGAIGTQRALLGQQKLTKFERDRLTDPALTLTHIPPGSVRLVIPAPPAAGKQARRAVLATTPKRQTRLVSALVWLPSKDSATASIAATAILAATAHANATSAAAAKAAGVALEARTAANSAATAASANEAKSSRAKEAYLAAKGDKLRREAERAVEALATAASSAEATAASLGVLAANAASDLASLTSDEQSAAANDPPRLAARMPELAPGWAAVVPLYGDLAPAPPGTDAPRSSTPLMGDKARVYYYHAGLHVTLRVKPEAKEAKEARDGKEGSLEVVLLEDEAALRALHLFRYRQHVLKEGVDLPPQLAVAASLRSDLRRSAAPRTAPHLVLPSALSALEGGSERGVGAFQPPFAELEVSFTDRDLPLRLKLRGASLAAQRVVFVAGFAPGEGPAERSGKIKHLDMLLSVNGSPVDSVEESAAAMARQPKGKITLRFRRSLSLYPPSLLTDPGASPLTPEEASLATALSAASAAGAERAAVRARRGAEGGGEEGRLVYAALSSSLASRTQPLPPLNRAIFPPPQVYPFQAYIYQNLTLPFKTTLIF